MSNITVPPSGAIPPTIGTFSLVSNTLEQTILDISNTARETRDVTVRFNVDALTKNNTVMRFRAAIDGATYSIHQTTTLSASDVEAHFDEPGLASSYRVTIQSATAEGASRNIPYELTQVRR